MGPRDLAKKLERLEQLASDCYYLGLDDGRSHQVLALFDERIHEAMFNRGRETTLQRLRTNAGALGIDMEASDELMAVSRAVAGEVSRVFTQLETTRRKN